MYKLCVFSSTVDCRGGGAKVKSGGFTCRYKSKSRAYHISQHRLVDRANGDYNKRWLNFGYRGTHLNDEYEEQST